MKPPLNSLDQDLYLDLHQIAHTHNYHLFDQDPQLFSTKSKKMLKNNCEREKKFLDPKLNLMDCAPARHKGSWELVEYFLYNPDNWQINKNKEMQTG